MRLALSLFTLSTLAALGACSENTVSADAPSSQEAIEDAATIAPATPSSEAAETMPEAEIVQVAPVESVMDGVRAERVSFAPGANSAIVEGSINGYDGVDYVLNVREGQPMNVSMATQNASAYFNILEPGEESEAVFIGSISGKQFEGVAEESGDYRIRVYLMRNAARRDETADYRLEIIAG